jgi:hypothetical protein
VSFAALSRLRRDILGKRIEIVGEGVAIFKLMPLVFKCNTLWY